MIRHVVMFQWADTVGDAELEAIVAGFGELPEAIPQVRRYEHGPDLGINENSFDYVVVAEFDSADDFITYRDSQVHQDFIRDHITGKAVARHAVQYEL